MDENFETKLMIYKPNKWQKGILTEDALTISEEGAGALTQQLVLQGLETFTFLIDDKQER